MNAEQQPAENTATKTALNIFAILGFVALLVIGIWSAIQVITFVPRLFGGETLSLSLPSFGNSSDIEVALSQSRIESGKPMTVSWERGDDMDGILSFAYACKEGFHFEIAGKPVACNAPYNIPASETELTVVPVLLQGDTIDAPLAVTYTDSEGESVRDTQTLAVEKGSGSIYKPPTHGGKEGTLTLGGSNADTKGGDSQVTTATPPAPTPAKPQTVQRTVRTVRVPVVRPSDPFGTADLQVAMMSIGAINAQGMYEPKGIVRAFERGAAKFKVTNLGTKETGTWTFTASLPTARQYAFQSQPQASIMPGASIEIFLTFDQLAPGPRNFTVSVDPFNAIRELNEQNNATGQLFQIVN